MRGGRPDDEKRAARLLSDVAQVADSLEGVVRAESFASDAGCDAVEHDEVWRCCRLVYGFPAPDSGVPEPQIELDRQLSATFISQSNTRSGF